MEPTTELPQVPETALPDADSTEVNDLITIPAINPTAEEMKELCANIKVNHDFKVDVKAVKFNFKKQKDKDTGIETVREAVELAIPYPSVEGILAILESGGKELELLQDAIDTVITAQARDIISDDFSINAANFPMDKVSWAVIANMPKAQRRGGGIPKEVWEAFLMDYVSIMPTITGKPIEHITNMSGILKNKLAQVKTNLPVLEKVLEQLTVYAENADNLEEFKDCVEFLITKADAFLNVSPEELLANL